VLAALPILCSAQDFSYKQFTTADGLSSNVVYSAFQDDKGYIWFCTNAGISRFDGIRFQNYTVKDGLSDNEVFQAIQTRNGKILFFTFNNKVCYYDSGGFHNEKTDSWLKHNFPVSIILYEDKEGNYWTFDGITNSVFMLNEQQQYIRKYPGIFGDSMIVMTDEVMDTLSVKDNDRISMEINQFKVGNEHIIDSLPDVRSYVVFLKNYIQELSKAHPAIPAHYLYALFLRQQIPKFRYLEFSYPQRDDRVWIAHGNMGIISCHNLFDRKEKATVYLPHKNISYFFIDREGNYWFTSNGEGVFLLTAHAVKNYRTESDTPPEIYSIVSNRTHIIAGKNNEVLFLNKASGEKFTLRLNAISASSLYNRVKDLLLDKNRLWIASDVGGTIFYLPANVQFLNGTLPRQSVFSTFALKCLSAGSGGEVYIGAHSKLLMADPRLKSKDLVSKRITAVAEISPGHLLLGSIDGLHTYYDGKITNYANGDDAFKKSITDIAIGKNGLICIATSEMGLILEKDKQRLMITSADSLPSGRRLASDICRKIFIDSSENIWVCTNQGLSIIRIASWNPMNYDIQRFTTDDGLLSNDVNDVYVEHDTVWVGTMSGLNMFRYDQIKRGGSLPLIYISNADSVDNRSFSFGTKINIGLQGISYESLGKIRYQYKLTGLNTTWQTTERHEVYYEVLPAGKYVLQVYAINRFNQKSAQPAIISFTVLPPWWQTHWAYFTYILSFASVLLGTVYLVKRNSRSKEKARMMHREQLQQLEMRALRSQMNPHFIFNTLNAIQKYILENDTDLSYRYLAKFAKLIRNFLENSRQTSIALQQELDLLQSYMEMEALRFRNKFSYEIVLDPMMDLSTIHIPSMLIQPYVENAIWHGIQHKTGTGLVKISIHHVDPGILKCSIEDNGVGRKMAEEIEVHSGVRHQPVGMTITQQRLELINQRLKDTVSVNFIDLKDALTGKECGTIVELMVTYSTKQSYELKSSNY
jgi:sensor histidine kinase YesM